MTVELSDLKGSVLEAAKELDLDASRLIKWRVDPKYKGGALLPTNDN